MRSQRHAGFTLVELMVALGVLAILIGIATPNFREFIANQRLKSATHELYLTLLYSRSEAIKRNGNVFIVPHGGGWAAGWAVTTISGKTYSECVADPADCPRIQDALGGVSVATTAATVTYDHRGRISSAPNPTFNLCGGGGMQQRVVTVTLTGQPAIQMGGVCP